MWEDGSFVVKPGDEDIHTANERMLKVVNHIHSLQSVMTDLLQYMCVVFSYIHGWQLL